MPDPHILFSVVAGTSSPNPPAKPGLPRGRLALPRGQNAAHQQLFDGFGPCIVQRRPDRRAAQNSRINTIEIPLKSTHRCAGGSCNDDFLHGLSS